MSVPNLTEEVVSRGASTHWAATSVPVSLAMNWGQTEEAVKVGPLCLCVSILSFPFFLPASLSILSIRPSSCLSVCICLCISVSLSLLHLDVSVSLSLCATIFSYSEHSRHDTSHGLSLLASISSSPGYGTCVCFQLHHHRHLSLHVFYPLLHPPFSCLSSSPCVCTHFTRFHSLYGNVTFHISSATHFNIC